MLIVRLDIRSNVTGLSQQLILQKFLLPHHQFPCSTFYLTNNTYVNHLRLEIVRISVLGSWFSNVSTIASAVAGFALFLTIAHNHNSCAQGKI